jgi:hypothetical protein
MQRDGQLHDAEAGAKMAACDRDSADHFGAELIGDSAQVALGKTA